MTTPLPAPATLQFGPLVLDVAEARLTLDGAALALRPKAFGLLVALASRPQQLVTKEELLDAVWGRRFVTEGVIKSTVGELRTALGDDPKAPRWIETVQKRGYRFIGVSSPRPGPDSGASARAAPTGALPAATTTSESASASASAAAPEPAPAPGPALEPAPAPAPRSASALETATARVDRKVTATPAESASPTPSAAAASAPPSPTSIGHVPLALAALIGRDADVVAVTSMIGTHRLSTIAGPSGVGKTRLALALADLQRDLWRDGVWFVELASIASENTDVAALCATLVQVLHLDHSAGIDAVAIGRALRPLHLLLVLDNAEHLLEPLASLVAGLLAEAPSLRIVVTSQEPLGLVDEQVFRLAPLALPAPSDDSDDQRLLGNAAVRLFVERVAGRVHGFVLAPRQQHAVASICRALDGLPLALELAAARVPLLGVHGLAALLEGGGDSVARDGSKTADGDARLQLLTGGARNAANRQRTLRNAIQWSHDLLDETQRQVFRRLGVFRGGFSIDAAQVVCADGVIDRWAVLDAVHALVDKSLLVPSGSARAPRFKLLESLRAFALERLAEAGEEQATRDRHLQAMLAHWARADTASMVEPGLSWIDENQPEIDNLRAALRWAVAEVRAEGLLRLVGHSALFWCRAGLFVEGRGWCEAARPHAGQAIHSELRGDFDLAIATLSIYLNAYPAAEALACAQRAVQGFTRVGDRMRAYFASYLEIQSGLRCQREVDRSSILDRMAALEGPEWNDFARRFLRNLKTYELRLAGRPEDYLLSCRTEVALCLSLGAIAEGWIAAQGLMLAEHDVGHVDAAIDVGRDALKMIRAAGRLRQYPPFIGVWATMLAQRGDIDETRIALVEALPILQSAGVPWMSHVALAWLAVQEGREHDAAQLLGWYKASTVSGRAVESGHYIARAVQGASDVLVKRLGKSTFERRCDEGTTLGDREAERVGLQLVDSADPA